MTQLSVTTGRATGNQVTQYQYFTRPSTAATDGQLHYVIESPGAGQATTELYYDSRGNAKKRCVARLSWLGMVTAAKTSYWETRLVRCDSLPTSAPTPRRRSSALSPFQRVGPPST